MFLFDVEKEKDMNAEIEDIFKEIKEQEENEEDDEDEKNEEDEEEENEIDGNEEEESEKEIDGRDEYLDVIEEDEDDVKVDEDDEVKEDEDDVKVDEDDEVKEDEEDEDFNVMKKFYSIEPESTGSYICEYCDKICKQNERVNTIRFLDKKYKKFEIIKNICIKCLNDMDF
jgi:hypothetical protein